MKKLDRQEAERAANCLKDITKITTASHFSSPKPIRPSTPIDRVEVAIEQGPSPD